MVDLRGLKSQSMMWYSSSKTCRHPLKTLSYKCFTSLNSLKQKFHSPLKQKSNQKLRNVQSKLFKNVENEKAWSVKIGLQFTHLTV